MRFEPRSKLCQTGLMNASSNTAVAIIGAGPAGLATAASLKARAIAYRLLEAGPGVGSSWRRHYQRLHLHTVKEHSALPGLPFPAHVERYPAREVVVAYLEAYARHHGLKVDYGVSLIRATRVDGGFSLTTSAGELRSRALVLATGYSRVPHQPSWPGQGEFGKTVIHSRAYFNGEPFKNQRVLVVGLGNTGGELALDLLEHGAQVALSVRGPVHVVPRDFLGQPLQVTSHSNLIFTAVGSRRTRGHGVEAGFRRPRALGHQATRTWPGHRLRRARASSAHRHRHH